MLYKYSNGQNKTFRDGRLLKSIYFLSVKLWKGILACSAGYDVVRFVPPLIITNAEVDIVISALDEILSSL